MSFAHCAKVMVVGNPNVGKSLIFGHLTDQYVTVSNYPGTTVTLTRGRMKLTDDASILVIDTPGVNNFLPTSEDEAVTRDIVMDMAPEAVVVQVIDTKNLQRGLFLTLQLCEMGWRGVVALNMWDEAQQAGYTVDVARLSTVFGVQFVPTTAIRKEGIEALKNAECRFLHYHLVYPPAIESAVAKLTGLLPASTITARALALMVLAVGTGPLACFATLSPHERQQMDAIRGETREALQADILTVINETRAREAEKISHSVLQRTAQRKARPLWEKSESLSTHPVWGFAMLIAILYALYLFVGVLGAGTLVGWCEKGLFNNIVNPSAIRASDWLLPFPHRHVVEEGSIVPEYTFTATLTAGEGVCRFLHDFLVGQYGAITMALTYGLAIILPVVLTFFLAFGILEDLGYLSRLSILLNRLFRVMGLNGKAVLPMVLGLGCDTMATVTARILETRKERMIVTFLLALAVPCSAQLAVIMVLLAASGLGFKGIIIWLTIIALTMLIAGAAASRLIPGDDNPLILEVPPFRIPELRNIVMKTLARVEWYIWEVIPVFLIGTAALFLLDEIGMIHKLEKLLHPLVVYWLGLPEQAAQTILMGFFRRDYSAAGFIHLAKDGMLSQAQILVGMTTITLFVPCIANALVMIKEQGIKVAIAMIAIILTIAFGMGGLLYRLLEWIPWLVK
jgi:ferrous iron transport protein B